MSRVLLTVLILLTSLILQATTFSTEVKMSRSREIIHTLNVTCNLGEDFCELLCQNQSNCVIEQKSCVDCVSQTYRLFKSIFTDLNQTFAAQPNQRTSKNDMIEFLRHERWMVLSHDSFYNTFTPELVAKNKMSFNSMCPNASQGPDALIIIQLDSAYRPEKISHLICQSDSRSVAYGVEFNPELTGDAATAQPVLRVDFKP